MNQLPFFVYGTLIPGQSNDHYWGDHILKTEPAELENALLFALGHFPMLVEPLETDSFAVKQRDEEEGEPNWARPNRVHGVLVTVKPDRYASIISGLDQLEAYDPLNEAQSLYLRRKRRTVDAAGNPKLAWAYIGKLSYTIGHPLIDDGDWVSYFQRCSTY